MPEFSNNPIITTAVDRDRRDLDIDPDIVRIVADYTPWTVLLRNIRKKLSNTAEFDWYEETLGGYYTTVGVAGYADSSTPGANTAVPVADSTIFLPNDVVKNTSSGECMLVKTVDSSTQITVYRMFGSSGTHGAGTSGQNLCCLGSAFPEGSLAPAPKQKQPGKKTNWTQIQRTSMQGTGTADAEKLRTTEAERQRERVSKLIDHNSALERGFLYGDGVEDTSGTYGSTTVQRSTKGIINYIATNVTNCNGIMTEALFEQICEGVFAYGSMTKLLVASTRVISILNQFGSGKLKTVVGEDTYGLRLKHYISAHGDIFVVKSRALEKDYAYYGFFLDLDYIEYKHLADRDTKLKMNIQAPDYDGWKDEYLTEAGLKFQAEQAQGYFYGAAA